MILAAVLAEIERAAGPITRVELARRLGVSADEVGAMLAALRAAGRLRPESGADPTENCPSSAGCRGTCPGPERCPLVVDMGIGGLAVQRPARLLEK